MEPIIIKLLEKLYNTLYHKKLNENSQNEKEIFKMNQQEEDLKDAILSIYYSPKTLENFIIKTQEELDVMVESQSLPSIGEYLAQREEYLYKVERDIITEKNIFKEENEEQLNLIKAFENSMSNIDFNIIENSDQAGVRDQLDPTSFFAGVDFKTILYITAAFVIIAAVIGSIGYIIYNRGKKPIETPTPTWEKDCELGLLLSKIKKIENIEKPKMDINTLKEFLSSLSENF